MVESFYGAVCGSNLCDIGMFVFIDQLYPLRTKTFAKVGLAVHFKDTTTGSSIGLSMVTLMGFNGGLSFLVKSWSNMETSLGAAARVRDFVQNTPSENKPSEQLKLPKEWPSKGAIDVVGVTATYK